MGPLKGIRIVEIAGIGPGPMCAMLLADLGATVIRVERKVAVDLGIRRPRKFDLLLRNRPAIRLDLKDGRAVGVVLKLIEKADGLIEGFRPGVMERLGLGPDACLARNPRLVYGRITGWGQDGPLAPRAGHDLNYIALTGILEAIGRRDEPPSLPLNLIGDFGGGALYLALGMLAGIIEARSSQKGQIVDAAMVDGAASLATQFFGMFAAGMWSKERGTNAIDSGSHFCEVYRCLDGRWIAVAAIEARFYSELLRRIGIDEEQLGDQWDRRCWPAAKKILADTFAAKTRDEWSSMLEDLDVCFAPVLAWDEAAHHRHLKHRGTIVEIDGVAQPAPAPRFSRTPSATPQPPREPDPADPTAGLKDWLSDEERAEMVRTGVFE